MSWAKAGAGRRRAPIRTLKTRPIRRADTDFTPFRCRCSSRVVATCAVSSFMFLRCQAQSCGTRACELHPLVGPARGRHPTRDLTARCCLRLDASVPRLSGARSLRAGVRSRPCRDADSNLRLLRVRRSSLVQRMPAQARWLMPREDLRASSGWPTTPQTIIPRRRARWPTPVRGGTRIRGNGLTPRLAVGEDQPAGARSLREPRGVTLCSSATQRSAP